jgi:hypothetical protein
MNTPELQAQIDRIAGLVEWQDALTLLAVAGVGYLLWRWLWS